MSGRTLLEALAPMPDDASVPVGWVREQLRDEPRRSPVDLTIEDAAELLEWKPSTLRNYMPELEGFGAYKLGRRWRIPEKALRRWQEWRSTAGPPENGGEEYDSTDLGAWRKERGR